MAPTTLPIVATPVAVVPTSWPVGIGGANVTVGGVVYPEPGVVIVTAATL